METEIYKRYSGSNKDTFYPTYEEWKHGLGMDKIKEIMKLFILPMRNGN